MTTIDNDKIIEVMAKAIATQSEPDADWEYCKATTGHPIYRSAMEEASAVLTALSSSGYIICQASDAETGEAVSRKSALQSDDGAEAYRNPLGRVHRAIMCAVQFKDFGKWEFDEAEGEQLFSTDNEQLAALDRACIDAARRAMRALADVEELPADFRAKCQEISYLPLPTFSEMFPTEEAQADTAAKAARLTTVAKACVEAIEDGDPDGAYTMLKHALRQLEEATQEPMSGPLSNETEA
jgi:hypothetical protein